MPADDQTFETVAAPAHRRPLRTAAWLAAAGALTIAVGAVLLVTTVGLLDNSLTSANERGADRTSYLGAEIPVGATEAVALDDKRAKTLLAIVSPEVPDDVATDELDVPTVRVAAPDGSPVRVIPGDALELTVDGRRTVVIGRWQRRAAMPAESASPTTCCPTPGISAELLAPSWPALPQPPCWASAP